MAYANYWNSTEETAMNFGLIAPSLTPTSALVSSLCPIIGPNTRIALDGNPAFTVYDVDPDTYDIMDRKVYIGKRITTNHTRTHSNKKHPSELDGSTLPNETYATLPVTRQAPSATNHCITP